MLYYIIFRSQLHLKTLYEAAYFPTDIFLRVVFNFQERKDFSGLKKSLFLSLCLFGELKAVFILC